MQGRCACNPTVILIQANTDDHSNEITAIPALLETVRIKGCVVAIDAVGGQTVIAKRIDGKKTEHVLAVEPLAMWYRTPGYQERVTPDVGYDIPGQRFSHA